MVIRFFAYEVERMLRTVNSTAPDRDDIPYWVFRQYSVELADIVAHYIQSLSTGVVPIQWLSAIITPVPKISTPSSSSSDFRPISATSILSRILEKYGVACYN